jgi:aldose sugar dehydrogenase
MLANGETAGPAENSASPSLRPTWGARVERAKFLPVPGTRRLGRRFAIDDIGGGRLSEEQHIPLWRRLLWYAGGALILLLLPVLKYSELWGTLPRPQKLALLVVLAAFAAAGLLSLWLDRSASWSAVRRSLVRSLAVLGLVLIAAEIVSITLPRYMLVPLVVVIAAIVPAAVSPVARHLWPLAALGALVVALSAYAISQVNVSPKVERTTRDAYFSTAFYPLRAVMREGWIPEPATRGGGLQVLNGDRVLLVTGEGHMYLLNVPADPAGFSVQELAMRVPANREEFAKALGGSARSPKRSTDWGEAGAPRVQTWRFRVADVKAIVDGDKVRIFASHHYWKEQGECIVVRVSETSTTLTDLLENVGEAQWTTLYETTPCVPLKGPNRKRGKNPFKGEEIGGKLLLLDDGKLLLTLGDQGFSGIESTQAFSQDPAVDYGKTLIIDLAPRERRIFTLGHRNPEGIYRAGDGKLWLTEHGPQGGDELNLLRENVNFGWPNVTYGTDYGFVAWPISKTQGRHTNYQQPAHSWVPSIGVSDVIEIDSKLFPTWTNDLLVGSLSTRSLYRIVLDGEHAVLQEPIALGKRVRDIQQLPDGRILVWSDDAALTTLEPAAALDGAGLFATQCSGCHVVVDGLSHRLGPDLFGIVGRAVGQAQGFDEYSPAMKAQGGTWDEARLDRFLQQPQTSVPGTSMGFPGVPDAAHRKAIIEYMKQHRGG